MRTDNNTDNVARIYTEKYDLCRITNINTWYIISKYLIPSQIMEWDMRHIIKTTSEPEEGVDILIAAFGRNNS